MLLKGLHVDIPEDIVQQMQAINELGDDVFTRDLPLHGRCQGIAGSAVQQALANSWMPCLTVPGAAGLPTPVGVLFPALLFLLLSTGTGMGAFFLGGRKVAA